MKNYNIRVKMTNHNKASVGFTFCNLSCKDHFDALRQAMDLAIESDKEFKPNAIKAFQTAEVTLSFVSNEALEQESIERCHEKAEFEYQCGGYDDMV